MKKVFSGFLACVLLALSFAGCSKGVSVKGLSASQAQGIADFSANFFNELYAQVSTRGETNPVVSPLSAYVVFALAGVGAGGDTAKEFEQVLGVSMEKAGEVCRTLLEYFKTTGEDTSLAIANSVWVNELYDIFDSYTRQAENDFDAEVFRRDFADGAVLGEINGWVKEKTNGLIPSILDSLDPSSAMVLLNTLYMNAKWEEEFSPNDTHKNTFTLVTGEEIKVDFMSSRKNQRCFVNSDMQGVLLPYNDGKLAFLAVMPFSGQLQNLAFSGDSIPQWAGRMKEKSNMVLQIPKFEYECEYSLEQVMKNMGLRFAFDQTAADFSGMWQSDAGDGLYISKSLQKVKITVGEEGTEAAAASGIIMGPTAAPSGDYEPPEYIIFDSPFLYAVIDTETNLPLFIGAVDEPPPSSIGDALFPIVA